MGRAIEKLVILFCLIVFVTFLINHGHIDFTGVDWVKNKTEQAVTSDEGQQYIKETKTISKNVFHDLFYGIKKVFTGKDETDDSEDSMQETTLLSCVDGDTIKVSIDGTETTVRLIGIDAPESVNPDESKNNEYGEKASEYTKKMLENINTLYLTYDVSKTDTYGRTLAYAWISNNTNDPANEMLNAILVKNGYANDTVYLPNNKYSDLFMSLRKTARENNTGLWQYEGYQKLCDSSSK